MTRFLRKAYVRLLVDKVEVTTTEIRILWSKAALEHAVLDNRIATGQVPSFTEIGAPGRTRTSTDFSIRF